MPKRGEGLQVEPGKKGMVTAVSIRMRAEIVSFDNGSLRGELYSHFLDKPYVFYSLLRMIEKMEEIFDKNRFPEKFMLPRTFGNAKSGKRAKTKGSEEMNDSERPEKNEATGGSKCTFEISVKFRQNATWQGQILWAEKNLKQTFRSVLEMLKLMDEALTDGEEKAAPVEWQN